MNRIVTEIATDVQKRERRLRLIRGAATICYMVFAGSGMMLLLTICLGSIGAHNSLGGEAIDIATHYGQWPWFYRLFIPAGLAITVVDLKLRYKRAYRYL